MMGALESRRGRLYLLSSRSSVTREVLNRVLLSDLFKGPEDPSMRTKFSQDVIPLTDLKVNPGRVVKHATDAHRPVLLTSRGRGVAVVQSVNDYEAAEEERAFMRAIVTGLADLEAGRELSLAEAKARLGLK
jgi:prevent-host-death family protein